MKKDTTPDISGVVPNMGKFNPFLYSAVINHAFSE
jgi:hypothetical protein